QGGRASPEGARREGPHARRRARAKAQESLTMRAVRRCAHLARAAALVGLAVLASSGTAHADSRAARAPEFALAVKAIEDGAFGEAIDQLELLADRGFVHPDASFDRAVAYIGRARSPQRQPGDLGRAAAALAETLALRPDDHEAQGALDAVRQELGRTRARTGGAPLVARPRLVRAIVGLLPEAVWGVLAALGSVSLA